jgi:hypothetical protein
VSFYHRLKLDLLDRRFCTPSLRIHDPGWLMASVVVDKTVQGVTRSRVKKFVVKDRAFSRISGVSGSGHFHHRIIIVIGVRAVRIRSADEA